jgi:hypothetical protein
MATVGGATDGPTPSKANPNPLPFAQQMFTRQSACQAEGSQPTQVNAEHKLQVRLCVGS